MAVWGSSSVSRHLQIEPHKILYSSTSAVAAAGHSRFFSLHPCYKYVHMDLDLMRRPQVRAYRKGESVKTEVKTPALETV